MVGTLRPFPHCIRTLATVTMKTSKPHAYYDHADACHLLRWTPRESYQYMYAKPWHKVADFYSDLVRRGAGASGLSCLFSEEVQGTSGNNECDVEFHQQQVDSKKGGGRWDRVSFKIVLSYSGSSFDGWQKQPGLNTVQGVMERALGEFVDDRKAKQLTAKSLPVEGCAVVAGRTDKGVSALQQVCSFYTWRKDVESEDVKDAINKLSLDKLHAIAVSKVPREFHPNFAAKWRRYLYVFPLEEESSACHCTSSASCVEDVNDRSLKPISFSASKVNRLLRQLEGKSLSYKMFARDTQASRSSGPATNCFMFHSRAAETRLPDAEATGGLGQRIMCFELVANRFLRRMVRVLVATAIREAAAGASDDALLDLMDASCRRATAPPAPPDGLCLVDVGYRDFELSNCFITLD